MKKLHAAFTMVELIFVIVVLGILAAVALPKLTGSIEDAYISKAQSHVSVIRSGLQNERSKSILKGEGAVYPELHTDPLFKNVIEGGVEGGTKGGEWEYDDSTKEYIFHTGPHRIYFEYNKSVGTFTCDRENTSPQTLCDRFQ